MNPATSEPRLTTEQLEAIANEIATFAARIDVAKHALLTRIRIFDANDAWGSLGFSSCAAWLSWRVGLGLTAAREQVRVARALGSLPKLDRVFRRGEISYSKVRAITRVATRQNEQDFIDVAAHATASQIERLTRSYRDILGRADTTPQSRQQREESRFVRRSAAPGGMTRIEIQLPPEEAAIVWDAVMAASSGRLPADASAEAPKFPVRDASAEAPKFPVRDASAEMPVLPRPHAPPKVPEFPRPHAPAYVPVPDGSKPELPGPHASAEAPVPDRRKPEQRHADAIVDVARAYLQHRPRTLGSGYELVLVTSKDQLEQGDPHRGVGGFLRDGTPVPLHIARTLACCGSKVEVTVGEHGEVLDVGRRTRVIPSAIGRALWLRDHGCRVPGCERRWHLQAHHIIGWAEGGPTKLSNLVLVCPTHHRMIHEGVLDVVLRDGQPRFIQAATSDRRELRTVPPSVATGAELDEFEAWLGNEGLEPSPEVNAPRWDGAPMRLAEAVDWMLLAHPAEG